MVERRFAGVEADRGVDHSCGAGARRGVGAVGFAGTEVLAPERVEVGAKRDGENGRQRRVRMQLEIEQRLFPAKAQRAERLAQRALAAVVGLIRAAELRATRKRGKKVRAVKSHE